MSKTTTRQKQITIKSIVFTFLGLFVFYLIANRIRN